MGYHPRIETSEMGSFVTTRSRNSELWFVNNSALEDAILGYAAKFGKRYGVKLYALAIEGNHIQSPADFPECNRASFMRDFNSCVARVLPYHVPEYPGGRFWGRRYSSEFLPAGDDTEEYFFYTILQAVQDGLVEKISEYPGYNCFHDAVWGIERKFKVVRWGEYRAALRCKHKVSKKDYTDIVTLKYERLPGYEHLSRKEYAALMHEKLEERRRKIVDARKRQGLGFAGRQALLKTRPGTLPRKTKTSTRHSHRPRVLSVCQARGKAARTWYFSVYAQYKEASHRYRSGELDVKFPPGTYMPPAVIRAIPPPG
jgi:putative transposase